MANAFQVAAWVMVGACCALSAQESAPLRSKSEEVLLDVVVRDKKGAPVSGLTQGDFTVLDDGVQKPIKGFRLVRGGDAVDLAGQKTQLDPMRQMRLISLIFGRTDPSGRALARQAALDLLKNPLPENVYIGVFVLDQTLKAVQQFTNNKDLLAKAIEKASMSSYAEFGSASDQLRDSIQETIGANRYGKQSLEEQINLFATGDTGRGPSPSAAFAKFSAEIMLQMLTFSERAEATQSGRSTIYALLAAVQGQSQLPGRKAIIYFTSGFFIPQGAQEAFDSVISTANRNNLSFYPVDSRGLVTTAMNKEAASRLAGAAQSSLSNGQATAIGDNHVTTDSALAFDEAIDSGKLNTQDTLAILARETGGFLTANTNDFRAPLQRVVDEIETYYEISYDPQIAAYDGSFHHVAVNAARADLRVQTRAGYFALPHSAMKNGLTAFEIPLLRALTVKPPAQAFPFESGAMHFRGEERSFTCGFLIDMPMINVTVRENKEKGSLNGGVAYVALVKDNLGEVVKKLQGDIPVDLTPDQALAFKQSRFTDMEYFDIRPGRYTVEVALLDKESGQTSARRSVLVVPQLDSKLSMSSVALIRKWRPKEPDAAPDDPFVVGDKTVTPTLAPRINKSVSTSLPFYFVAYPNPQNASPLALTIEFSRDGQVKRLASATLPPPDAQGRVQYVANAPIGQFDFGNYSVHFIVKQGTQVAEENFAIVLEP